MNIKPNETISENDEVAILRRACNELAINNSWLRSTHKLMLIVVLVCAVLGIVSLIVAAISISTVASRPKIIQHWTVDEYGRLLNEVKPKSKLETERKLREFVNDCVVQSFEVDFVHFVKQLNNIKNCYSEEGHADFIKNFISSGHLKNLKKDGAVGKMTPVQANYIDESGPYKNTYRWVVQGTYVWTLASGSGKPTFPFNIRVVVERVPTTVKRDGFEIKSIITSESSL